jgi:hypothetical protein
MKLRLSLLVIFGLIAISLLLVLVFRNTLPVSSVDDEPIVSTLPMTIPDSKPSWLTLDELPDSATEADFGAEVYRLVCKACHGDQGQGLTDEWRATWSLDDQNCWQSKCHAPNHPPEGFILPEFVPAIIGPATRIQFSEPADLYEFIRARMPWHAPGTLTDEEYRQLTAFIIRENGGS